MLQTEVNTVVFTVFIMFPNIIDSKLGSRNAVNV